MKNNTPTPPASEDGCHACQAEYPDYYWCMNCTAMICRSCKIQKDGKDIGCKLCIPATVWTQQTPAQATAPHTAGPWKYQRLNLDYAGTDPALFRIYTDAPTHPDIADVFYRDTDEEAEANAQRIVTCVKACEGIRAAAVPGLLTALQEIADHCRDFWDEDKDISTSDLVCAIEAITEYAIATAHGKTS